MGWRTHDPERDAAAYVSGEMGQSERERFEAHVLGCDDCWGEVSIGRDGRAMAEAAREMAPAGLSDSIRGVVSAGPIPQPARRRLALVPAAVLLLAIVVVVGALLGSRGEPGPIAAAVAAARTQTIAARGPSVRPAPDLARMGLALVVDGRVELAGLPSDAFLYRTSSGDSVVLFVSDESFPVARDATLREMGNGGWSARSDGMTLVCGNRPTNYLVIAQDPSLEGLVEHAFVSGSSTD